MYTIFLSHARPPKTLRQTSATSRLGGTVALFGTTQRTDAQRTLENQIQNTQQEPPPPPPPPLFLGPFRNTKDPLTAHTRLPIHVAARRRSCSPFWRSQARVLKGNENRHMQKAKGNRQNHMHIVLVFFVQFNSFVIVFFTCNAVNFCFFKCVWLVCIYVCASRMCQVWKGPPLRDVCGCFITSKAAFFSTRKYTYESKHTSS